MLQDLQQLMMKEGLSLDLYGFEMPLGMKTEL